MTRELTPLDRLLAGADEALRTLTGHHVPSRPMPRPGAGLQAADLTTAERQLSGSLMRVNHVGEICAQALYQAQALATRKPSLKAHFAAASREEADHLAWSEQRLRDLGDRVSILNPLWYAGAFTIGLVAGRIGDRTSLGFVVETEKQVEKHLDGHLSRLPVADIDSRAVVQQMMSDEAQHARNAQGAGGKRLPMPVRLMMRAAAKVMTTVAARI
ncbi:2-polyprenyl-3-methyl-6-methoxy-1,4-benzoquinone monooxygenase [soil metagenome]